MFNDSRFGRAVTVGRKGANAGWTMVSIAKAIETAEYGGQEVRQILRHEPWAKPCGGIAVQPHSSGGGEPCGE